MVSLQTAMQSDAKVCSVIHFVCVKVFAPTENHHQLVEVYGASGILLAKLCMWYLAFSNGKAC